MTKTNRTFKFDGHWFFHVLAFLASFEERSHLYRYLGKLIKCLISDLCGITRSSSMVICFPVRMHVLLYIIFYILNWIHISFWEVLTFSLWIIYGKDRPIELHHQEYDALYSVSWSLICWKGGSYFWATNVPICWVCGTFRK